MAKSKTTTKKRGSAAKKQEEDNVFGALCAAILICAVSAILFLGNINLGGAFGEALSSGVFGVMGIFAYIFPLLLAGAAIYLLINRKDKKAAAKVWIGLCSLILLCLMVELFVHGNRPVGAVRAFYEGSNNHTGGGFFGGLLSSGTVRAFGRAGSFVLDIVALLFCFLMISDANPITNALTESKERKKERIRDLEEKKADREIRRNIHREHREVKKKAKKRTQNKVKGVSFDTQIVPTDPVPVSEPAALPQKKTDEVSELNISMYGEDLPEEKEQEQEPEAVVSYVDLVAKNDEEKEKILRYDPEDELPVISAPAELPPEPEPLFVDETDETEEEPAETEGSDAPIETVREDEPEEEPLPEKPRPAPAPKKKKAVQEAAAPADASKAKKPYQFPPKNLLDKPKKKAKGDSRALLSETADKLQQTLKNFGVQVEILNVTCGPSVTRYEIAPQMGVKVSKIVNLADDIKLNLAAEDIRIEAPIPGKAAVGIEVPNKEKVMVPFRELVESREFIENKSNIAFAAGRDIAGQVILSDIAKMPHVLIAGATGSGKSVCINTIIMSILYRANPEDVKFIMIDPKVVELSVYNGIPHLLLPVVTDPKKAAGALNWAVHEMMDRYDKFAKTGVRDMKGYNAQIKDGFMTIDDHGQSVEIAVEKMPQIVVIVDELADLMMVASKEVEESICRLAQLARAAGIHLVVATQRPSVNVITGLIKANMPSRIAFSVSSGVDSRTILDMTGAEKLLGKGDMLYYPQGFTKPIRVQGAFVTDDEVRNVVDYLKANNETKEYDESIETEIEDKMVPADDAVEIPNSNGGDDRDAYFDDAAQLLIDKEKGSIGMLQRYFKIGFNRAARIMDQLEEAGVVGPEEGTKPRRVIMTMEEYEESKQAV